MSNESRYMYMLILEALFDISSSEINSLITKNILVTDELISLIEKHEKILL